MDQDEQALFGLNELNVARSEIPQSRNLDYLARINPLYHRLFRGFDERIGCPVLANTSFNLHGKPIVCTPEDAFRSAEIKLLVGGNGILDKTRQNLP